MDIASCEDIKIFDLVFLIWWEKQFIPIHTRRALFSVSADRKTSRSRLLVCKRSLLWSPREKENGQVMPVASIPKHLVSIPLQSPDDRHSLTAEPTSMYPESQVNIAVDPYVIWVPILFPFGGVGSSPQEITSWQNKNKTQVCSWESKTRIQ